MRWRSVGGSGMRRRCLLDRDARRRRGRRGRRRLLECGLGLGFGLGLGLGFVLGLGFGRELLELLGGSTRCAVVLVRGDELLEVIFWRGRLRRTLGDGLWLWR